MTYSEDGLVEQPAIALFDSLGWETEACWDEAFGSDAGGDLAFGRETRNDVVLTSRLREALLKLNKGIPSLILQEAADEMCRDRSSMSDIAANEAIYLLLKDGYVYTSTSDDDEDFVVRYIDWETVDNNDFLLCSQMSISGEIETRRPDLLGFVNGLPPSGRIVVTVKN